MQCSKLDFLGVCHGLDGCRGCYLSKVLNTSKSSSLSDFSLCRNI